jgi:hypothetical protein
VILTHGKLTGGSLLTRQKAIQHEKPVLHLDMDKLGVDDAVDLVKDFVDENAIEVLNVAGSRASGDVEIYEKTFQVLETVILND